MFPVNWNGPRQGIAGAVRFPHARLPASGFFPTAGPLAGSPPAGEDDRLGPLPGPRLSRDIAVFAVGHSPQTEFPSAALAGSPWRRPRPSVFRAALRPKWLASKHTGVSSRGCPPVLLAGEPAARGPGWCSSVPRPLPGRRALARSARPAPRGRRQQGAGRQPLRGTSSDQAGDRKKKGRRSPTAARSPQPRTFGAGTSPACGCSVGMLTGRSPQTSNLAADSGPGRGCSPVRT